MVGIWEFEGIFVDRLANAKEAVTDPDGRFKLPMTWAYSFLPITRIRWWNLIVFKTGYDSHPPAIQRRIKKPDRIKNPSSDGIYYIGRGADCKARKECVVRLNKAINDEERIAVILKCENCLDYKINPSKIKYLEEVLKIERQQLNRPLIILR